MATLCYDEAVSHQRGLKIGGGLLICIPFFMFFQAVLQYSVRKWSEGIWSCLRSLPYYAADYFPYPICDFRALRARFNMATQICGAWVAVT